MDSDFVLHIGRRSLETAMLLSAPVLGVTLAIGVLTAILQAVTSIKDMTIAQVLKLLGAGLTLLLCGGWMMDVASSFTMEIFHAIQTAGLGGGH